MAIATPACPTSPPPPASPRPCSTTISRARGSCTRRSSRAPPHELLAAVAAAVGEAGDAEERLPGGVLASFRLIEHRPDVRSLLLGEPGADERVARASAEAQRTARTAMAALYLSEPSFLAGVRNRRARAEHVAQGAIGTINGLGGAGGGGGAHAGAAHGAGDGPAVARNRCNARRRLSGLAPRRPSRRARPRSAGPRDARPDAPRRSRRRRPPRAARARRARTPRR